MRRAFFVVLGVALLLWIAAPIAQASVVLGTGTASLLGSDLTDPENNGDPENNVNYNSIFTASEEPNFGGSEGAFNVFDNQVGGGNMKWCCGDQNNFPTNPISITANFGANQHVLSHFTLTSGNDSPERDPRRFEIQGSDDGTNWTTIYARTDGTTTPWGNRDEVIRWNGGGADFATPAAYSQIRFITFETGTATGARFQLGEIEYFANPVPEPSTLAMAAFGIICFAIGRYRRRCVA